LRIFHLALPLLAVMSAGAMAQQADDPYLWLEEKDSPRALEWVEAENARTAAVLEADPRYRSFYDTAFELSTATDRIAYPAFRNGRLANFWQDAEHIRGIWRFTTLNQYRAGDPQWETVLDIDALGAAEGRSWVWKGSTCLEPARELCLISLSDGGEDATEVREFEFAANGFKTGGFVLPTSQHAFDWEDEDHLLVATDWTGDDLTASGYPYIVKRVARGQPLAEAIELFRGSRSDAGVFPSVLRDGHANRLSLLIKAIDFFHSEHFLLDGSVTRLLAIPQKASVLAMVAGRVIVSIDEDWSAGGQTFRAGSLLSLDLDALRRDPANLAPGLVWAPGPRDALQSVTQTKDRLLVGTLDNVRGRIWSFEPKADGGWSARQLALPDNLSLGVHDAAPDSNLAFLTATGFLTPDTLYLADVADPAAPVALRELPARFDAATHLVEQHEATSSDGTKIPYFVVRPKDAPLDGSTPTLMTAYGGFQSSEVPYYSGTIGKLWLERGGAFVLANIRGGGEFGPVWHQAGLGAKRQVIYDDFAAVSRDLAARGLTSPRRLGIYGGSNGGLLMGVAMIQNPQLYNAIAIQIPLLDMIRIADIERGASWQGEYGDVAADPEIRAFWEKTSPYQNLDPQGRYPEPWIFTTTKDDRTGPQHARKFAARMKEYGLPYLYFENTEGGHGAGADARQAAAMYAQMMVYFSRKLMD
jgi:prolyl oligopeptidase